MGVTWESVYLSVLCPPTDNTLRRLAVYTPQMKLVGYTGVTLSVRPCIMKSCPGHNFQSIEASNFKLHTQITLRTSAVYKNHNSIPSIFGVIAFCKF